MAQKAGDARPRTVPFRLNKSVINYGVLATPNRQIRIINLLQTVRLESCCLPQLPLCAPSPTYRPAYAHFRPWPIRWIGPIGAEFPEKRIGIPLHITGAIGAIILVLFGIITEQQAYRSIDAKTIFLFGGTLALATAMQKTGAGEVIASTVLAPLGSQTPMFLIMLVIFLLAMTMTNFMSNTATTALLVPIGISISASIGADPRAVMMAIVIGGSMAYATPIGMPANVMVLRPGNLKFYDYARAGVPLIIVVGTVAMILLPILYPFYP